MKKIKDNFRHIARMVTSIALCLIMLCGNMASVLADLEPVSTGIWSNEVGNFGGLGGPILMAQYSGMSVPLSDWATITVDMRAGSPLAPITSGVTLPRGSDVEMTINFALIDTLQSLTDETTSFTAQLPTTITISNISDSYYDDKGVKLMDWSIVNNVLTVRFTADFYSKTRPNARGFVTFSGTLKTDCIEDGQVIYHFPGDNTFVINYPLGAVNATKEIESVSLDANGIPVAVYKVNFWAADNMKSFIITDGPVEAGFIDIDFTSATLMKNGATATDAIVTGDAATKTFTVTANSGNLAGNNTTYTVRYKATLPLDALFNGQLAGTVTATRDKRTNSASIAWTAYEGTTGTITKTAAINYTNNNLVTLTKTFSGVENGMAVFRITVTTQIDFDELTVIDEPGDFLKGGKMYDSDGTELSGLTITVPKTKGTYVYTYRVPFPYDKMVSGELNQTATQAARTNKATLSWKKDIPGGIQQTGAIERTVIVTASGSLSVTKSYGAVTFDNTTGKYQVEFTVTIPASRFTYSGMKMAVVDELGANLELVESSIRMNNSAAGANTFALTRDAVNPNLITLTIANYVATTQYRFTYKANLSMDALVAGEFLKENLNDSPELKAKASNSAKAVWYYPSGAYGGETSAVGTTVSYDVSLPLVRDFTKTINKQMYYDSSWGKYVVNYTYSFKLLTRMDTLTIDDLYPLMFAKTLSGADLGTWLGKLVPGGAFTTYPAAWTSATKTYDKFTFTNLEAGTYTITFPAVVGFPGNSVAFRDVQNDSAVRKNTATLTYKRGTLAEQTLTADATASVGSLTISKAGEVVLTKGNNGNGEGQGNGGGEIQTVTIDGYQYAVIKWTVTLASSGLDLTGGTLTDTLFGRQMFAVPSGNSYKASTNGVGVVNVGGKSNSAMKYYKAETVGSQQFYQTFVYDIGNAGEGTAAGTYVYTYYSLIRLPDMAATMTAENQVVLTHPYWGKFTANAATTFEWSNIGGGTGTGGTGSVNKSLIKVEKSGDGTKSIATWQVKLNLNKGKDTSFALYNAIFSDYLNCWAPDAYLDIAAYPPVVRYANGDTPAYTGPSVAYDSNIGNYRLFITFTEPLTDNVIITYYTVHDTSSFQEKSKTIRNFADLEYTSQNGEYKYYVIGDDAWYVDKTTFKKDVVYRDSGDASAVYYDETTKQYVIDWTITFDDAMRTGTSVKVVDTFHPWLEMTGTPTTQPSLTGFNYTTSGNTVTFTFTPTQKTTVIHFRTAIKDEYLSSTFTATNVAYLRKMDDSDNAAASEAATPFTKARTFTKAASNPFYGGSASSAGIMEKYPMVTDKDQYFVEWSITLTDKSRATRQAYIMDVLPLEVTLLPNTVKSDGRGVTVEDEGGNIYTFVLAPTTADKDTVTITFLTSVKDEYLTKQSGVLTLVNRIYLLNHSRSEAVDQAMATSSLSYPIRILTKTGRAFYDAEAGKFVIDWTISLMENARAGQTIYMTETLPEGLTAESLTVHYADATTATPSFSTTNSQFNFEFTAKDGPMTIVIRTAVPPAHLVATQEAGIHSYTNKVDLKKSAGGATLDSATATVEINTKNNFSKTVGKAATLDTTTGKYVIEWKLTLDSDLLVGVLTRIDDSLPEGLTFAEVAARVTEGSSSTPLALTQNGRNIQMMLTPNTNKTVVTVYATIDNSHLFYDPSAAENNGPRTFVNNAEVKHADGSSMNPALLGSAETSFGVPFTDVLDKTSRKGTNNHIVFEVDVNKNGISLADGGQTITLYDILTEDLTLLIDTVKVLNANGSEMASGVDYRFTYIASERKMVFELPNRRHVKLVFHALLNGKPGDKVEVTNTITLDMGGIYSTSKKTEYEVERATSGLAYDADCVMVVKYDSEDSSIMLAGAGFTVYEVNYQTKTETVKAYGETDQDGIVYLPSEYGGLERDKLYCLQETKFPTEYLAKSPNPKYYFFIPGEDAPTSQNILSAIKAAGYTNVLESTSPTYNIDNQIDLKNRVLIRKEDGKGNQLPGAALQIWSTNAQGEKDQMLMEFVTGSIKNTFTNKLETGKTYVLVEVTPPAGYLKAADMKFTLTADGDGVGRAEVVMIDKKPSVPIVKLGKVGDNEAPLSGAELRVTDPENKVVAEWLSTAEPYVLSELEVGKIYRLTELSAPVGYLRAPYDILFSIGVDGTITWRNAVADSPTSTASAVTLLNTAQITVIKLDESGKPLSGADFGLFAGYPAAKDAEALHTWKSGLAAHVVPMNLTPGQYTLREINPPAGYARIDDIQVTLKEGQGEVFTITNTLKDIKKITLTINKTWVDQSVSPVHPAVIFDLYRSDDPTTPIDSVTLANGQASCKFENLPVSNQMETVFYDYWVVERPVPGYLSETITYLQDQATGNMTATAVNKETKLTIIKQAGETKTALAGAGLQIWTKAAEGNPSVLVVDGITSATPSVDVTGKLTGGVTYLLRETTAPVGYRKAADVEFTMDAVNKTVEMKDPPTVVEIRKVNRAGALLHNATLEVLDGALRIGTYTTDTSRVQVITASGVPQSGNYSALDQGVIVLEGILEEGKTYTLKETKPPAGYKLADPVTFTVTINENTGRAVVTLEDESYNDKQFTLTIHKVDQFGDHLSADVEMIITSPDKPDFEPRTITVRGGQYSDLYDAGYTYVITEKAAPEGYRLADPVTVYMDEDKEVWIEDEIYEVNIRGTKTWNDAGLEGLRPSPVTIQLFRDGETTPLRETNVGPDGTYRFENLPAVDSSDPGNPRKYVYTVREKQVDGYVTTKNGNDFVNTPTRTGDISKVNERGDLMGGAVLEVFTSGNEKVLEWNTTTENPKKIEAVLNPGTYYVKEKSTVHGYALDTTEYGFTINGDGSCVFEASGNASITIQNKPVNWQLVIEKVVMEDGSKVYLDGAELELYDKEDMATVLTGWTTGAEPGSNPKTFTGLDPTKTYVLKEKSAPGAYSIAMPIEFTVIGNTAVVQQTVTMVNTLVPTTTITVTKEWDDLSALPAHDKVTFDLIRKGSPDEVVQSVDLESGEISCKFTDVPVQDQEGNPYTYEVKERVNEGYQPTYGALTRNGDGTYSITVTNHETKMTVKKLAGEGGSILAGATLVIRDKDDTKTIAGPFNTTAVAYSVIGRLTVGETYLLKETGAPDGFIPAKAQEFTVDSARDFEVTMIDPPTVVYIYKENADGTLLLDDAELEIRDGDTVVASFITTTAVQVLSFGGVKPGTYTGLRPGTVVIEGLLKAGKSYTLHEVDSPWSYQLNTAAIPFTVDEITGVGQATIRNTSEAGSAEISIDKIDDYGDPVIGAKLTVTNDYDNEEITWVTNGAPKAISLPVNRQITYTVTEVETPEGYITADPITFVVDGNQSYLVEMMDKIDSVNIHGTKTWDDHGKVLEHAEVTIELHQNGTLYKETKVENGEYHFTNLPVVDNARKKYVYTVKEKHVPGYVTTLEGYAFTNKATSLTVLKTDPDNNKLPGVVLAIEDAEGNEMIRWSTSDADGNPKQIVGLLDAKEEYTLKEISAPAGYELLEDTKFTLADSANVNITLKNKLIPWKLKVEKVAKVDGTSVNLNGAALELYDAADLNTPLVGYQWTTDSGNNPRVFENLDPRKTYVLKEKTAPDGFVAADPITFTAGDAAEDGQQTVTMINYMNVIAVQKVDQSTQQLSGAWLEIRDSKNEVIRSWISTGNAIDIKGLKVNEEYTLAEVVPPAGYITQLTTIKFKLGTDGTIAWTGSGTQTASGKTIEQFVAVGVSPIYDTVGVKDTLTVTDDALNVQISKRKTLTTDALAGAEMALYEGKVAPNQSPIPYLTWISGTTPYVPVKPLVAGAWYTLRELNAPDGYVPAVDIQFQVEDKTELQLIEMKDPETWVSITKQDESGNFLVGATFTLTEKNGGKLIDTWITTNAKQVYRGVLVAGRTYVATETDAPVGYGTVEPREFTVREDALELEIILQDHPLEVLIAKRDKDTNQFVEGVRLQLYEGENTSGRLMDEWTTTSANHKPQEILESGRKYTIHEVKERDGYVLAGYTTDLTFTVDGSQKQQIVVFQNEKNKVSVTKRDEQTGNMLAGATLRIVRTDVSPEQTVATWVSKSTAPEMISGLIPGARYRLEEVSPPAGFATAQSIDFSIPGDGKLYELEMQDPHIYRFLKVDAQTKAALSGATLRIEDTSGNIIVPEWISGSRAYEVIGTLEPGRTYKLVEVKAPGGYSLASPVTFKVPLNGTLGTVTMADVKVGSATETPGPGGNTINIRVTKTWNDYNNVGGTRPASITLNLYRKLANDAAYPTTPYLTVSMTGGGTARTWTFTFSRLDRSSGGVRYEYLVQENPVPGYQVTYANNGQSILNYLPDNPNSPTPTPFATPTPGPDDPGFTRGAVGVELVDGQWVYIDEYGTPLGVVPLTGDDTDWLIWGAAIIVPLLVAAWAAVELRRRKKRMAK